MKFYTKMPETLKPYFLRELKSYKKLLLQKDYRSAWRSLERAHIIGQPYPFAHTLIHWEMLKFGFRIKDFREVLGQIPRLLVGGIKSFVGKIPVGNTGGANVPPLQPTPIPEDILRIIQSTKLKK